MRIYPFESLHELKETNRPLSDLLQPSIHHDKHVVLGYWQMRDDDTTLSALTDRQVIQIWMQGSFNRLISRVLGYSEGPESSIRTLPLENVMSVDLENVMSVDQERRRLGGLPPEWITLTSYSGATSISFFFPSRDESYHRMLKLLHESVDRARSHQQAPSAADRLRELTALRDDGLITEDEFQTKRQQLIANL